MFFAFEFSGFQANPAQDLAFDPVLNCFKVDIREWYGQQKGTPISRVLCREAVKVYHQSAVQNVPPEARFCPIEGYGQ